MNTFSTRTRRGAAILFSGVLVLGGLAVAGGASAVKNVDNNPTCEYLGYTYGEKWDDEPSAETYTLNRDGMEASLTVGTHPDKPEPNENNAITAYKISTAGDYTIVVKGGNDATVYGPGAKVPLHAPVLTNGKWPTISHFDLCWNKKAPQPEVGQLIVTKVVVGTDTPDDYTFEICVTPAVGGTRVCKDIVGNGATTFGNLPTGDYVVTETNPGPRFSVEGSGVTVTVKLEDTTRTTVTNTWIPPSEKFGQVVVTKVVTGEGAPIDDEYEICLTGPDASITKQCQMVEDDETVTFKKLVPGTYTVTETNPGTEYKVMITDTDTPVVTAGGVTKITVTNAYTAPTTPPPEEEVVPPTEEALPPTTPVIPTTPVTPSAPAAPVTPAAPTQVAAQQSALPATGSEGGLAAIAVVLVAAGVGLTLLSKRHGPQQA